MDPLLVADTVDNGAKWIKMTRKLQRPLRRLDMALPLLNETAVRTAH